MKNNYEMKVKYTNSCGEHQFICSQKSVNICFTRVKNILCDEILSIKIKKL